MCHSISVDASDRCNRQFEERKGIEMKATRALQRNRFLRIVGNYNVSVKINVYRGDNRWVKEGEERRLWNLNRKEEIHIFFLFAYITINSTFFPTNFYVFALRMNINARDDGLKFKN